METKQIIRWLYDKAARAQDHSYARMLNMIAKLVRELDEKQRWIPVTKRLPEEWVDVLVWSEYGFCETAVYLGIRGRWLVSWNHDMLDADTVTHWMPLPEPPKEVDG